MRRTVWAGLVLAVLAGCGSSTTSAEDFAKEQTEVDSAARIMAITVGEALDGQEPPGDLGVGRSTGCGDGPGGVFYFVDTFVTHRAIDADRALALIQKAVRAEGYDAKTVGGSVQVTAGDATVEISQQGRENPPTGHGIYVSTDCTEVGEKLAKKLVADPGRTVTR